MLDRIRFFLNRVRERLWVRPLIYCILSVSGTFLAKMVDNTKISPIVPQINPESIETLLSIIASSMLVISTFAVASMLSAYSAAGRTATPRSYSLVMSDDVSQNALSTFIAAFIFSIVALVALKNGYYEKAGHFALFTLTIILFAWVIMTFLRWVDRIAQLGRLATTIDKVEKAATASMQRRRRAPTLGGAPVGRFKDADQAIYGSSIGYVQRIDINTLQAYAEEKGIRIIVAALPGAFSAPGRVIAYLTSNPGDLSEDDSKKIGDAFQIGNDRTFDEDPRFGLIALSEIASRALSPAVNDPGTAIAIIGKFVRLFALWAEPIEEDDKKSIEYDHVEVPEISLWDMFDDAFTPIARDGAGTVEVAVRLQKAFESLASIGVTSLRDVAIHYARLARARAENALAAPEDLEVLRKASKFANPV
jgi:uncharacterized membrane protein